jgi:hypothetical protein
VVKGKGRVVRVGDCVNRVEAGLGEVINVVDSGREGCVGGI